MEGVKTTVQQSRTAKSNYVVLQSESGSGSMTETMALPSFAGGGNFSAPGGITVQIPDGDFKSQIQSLSAQPGMGYLNDLAARKDVNWQPVKLAHEQWSYSRSGSGLPGRHEGRSDRGHGDHHRDHFKGYGLIGLANFTIIYEASMIDDVYVITYCRSMDLFYGSSLFFETVRVGFPAARIRIIENGSIPDANLKLRGMAKNIDAEFVSIAEHPHWELVQNIFMSARRSFAVVDPDIIFWERMDDSHGVISGRLIPTFRDPFSGCITMERLHTSLLKVSDPQRLQSLIRSISQGRFEWRPFLPAMLEMNGKWIRYDTAAVLYSSIKSLSMPFGEKELDSYDHLFCGSHLDQVLPKLGSLGDEFLRIHQEASRGNLNSLKGIWRIQDEFFKLHGA